MYTTKAEREEKLQNKRTRLDADSVESMILRAFKKHQYISQKHLVSITGQPEVCAKVQMYLYAIVHLLIRMIPDDIISYGGLLCNIAWWMVCCKFTLLLKPMV